MTVARGRQMRRVEEAVVHWRQMRSVEAVVAEVAEQRRMGQQRQMAQHASPVVVGIWGAASGEFHDGQGQYLSNGIPCS